MAESRGRRLRRSLERGDGGAEAREVSDADDTPVADGRDGPVPADREVAPRLERPVVERVLLDADGPEPNQDVVAPADAFGELDAVSLSESLREHALDLLALRRRRLRREPMPLDLRIEQLPDGLEVAGQERSIATEDEVDVVAGHAFQPIARNRPNVRRTAVSSHVPTTRPGLSAASGPPDLRVRPSRFAGSGATGERPNCVRVTRRSA